MSAYLSGDIQQVTSRWRAEVTVPMNQSNRQESSESLQWNDNGMRVVVWITGRLLMG